jgi:homeobox protein cut-like
MEKYGQHNTSHECCLIAGLDVDLTNLVPALDQTASDLISHQKDSLIQRKDLAQKTKDFRKLEDAEKLQEYKSLLKGESPIFLYDHVH